MKTILLDGELLKIKCEPGKVSDGYHTFDELYEHRCLLFCWLLVFVRQEEERPAGFDLECWKSRKHSDGSSFPGWFVAGIESPVFGQITYHLPDRMWELLPSVEKMETAPPFDGHTSQDVINRLTEWLKEGV